MLKKICSLIVIGLFLFLCSGCAVVGAALVAGASYGIAQAFK